MARLWMLWPVAYGLAIGAAWWCWNDPELLKLLSTNKLPWPKRLDAIRYLGLGLGAVFGVYAAASLVMRVVRKEWRTLEVAGRLNRHLAFTLALPVVAWLGRVAVERDDPILTAVLCAVAAGCVAV